MLAVNAHLMLLYLFIYRQCKGTTKFELYKEKEHFFSTCTVEITQYALNQRSPAEGKGKGQKLLAQGTALG